MTGRRRQKLQFRVDDISSGKANEGPEKEQMRWEEVDMSHRKHPG